MLCWIAILGGLLVMIGQHSRSESLFYYFRLEDHIPENHLLRLIDRHVSFDFVRAKLKDSYSEMGRPWAHLGLSQRTNCALESISECIAAPTREF